MSNPAPVRFTLSNGVLRHEPGFTLSRRDGCDGYLEIMLLTLITFLSIQVRIVHNDLLGDDCSSCWIGAFYTDFSSFSGVTVDHLVFRSCSRFRT